MAFSKGVHVSGRPVHRYLMRSIHNENINSCTSDLSTDGDTSGMKACFLEAGLDVPDDDGYYSEETNTSVGVIEIF